MNIKNEYIRDSHTAGMSLSDVCFVVLIETIGFVALIKELHAFRYKLNIFGALALKMPLLLDHF
jgi:hypothetical protein